MIIYGSRAVHLNTVQLPNKKCPSCQADGSLELSVFRRHFHVFWIPFFPLWKQGVAHCMNCKEEFKVKKLPESIKIEYDNLKANSKGPIWQFSGLGLIACLVVGMTYASGVDAENELEYITAPLAGDVYEYKVESGNYSTLKVDRVTADSVYVLENLYEINRITKLYKIDKSENYLPESYGISRSRIKLMHDSGEIMNIKRD